MKKLNIAVVGYGGMGRYHATGLIKQEENLFNKPLVYDIDPEKIKQAKEEGFTTYESFEAVLGDETMDVVLIATPNDSHKPLAIALLKAGKHVICEKPAMMSVAELDEVLAVSKETNKVFMVHQNRRWDPDFLVVKNLYENKQLGDIFQIESRVHGANGIPGDWRHVKEQGGGMVLDWGVHLFDQLLYMIDSPITKVDSTLSFVLGNQVDDGFTARIHFENNLEILVEVGTTNYIKLPRWYVKGTSGTAVISDWDLSGEMIIRRDGNLPQHKNLAPIQAGVGLTKTMAPPSEEDTKVMELPAPLTHPYSYYENLYGVIMNNETPFVKNEQVRNVMVLMERVMQI